MLCSDPCPKGQFYDTALFMQLSHNRVAQQSLNSLGGAERRRQREMSEVRKCSETSQPQAFTSGPQGRQVGRATAGTGRGHYLSQGAPPAALLMQTQEGKEYLIVIRRDPNESTKGHRWELHRPAQTTYTLSQQRQLFKTHVLGNSKQRNSLFYREISHIECHLFHTWLWIPFLHERAGLTTWAVEAVSKQAHSFASA